ncbi:hypothetical protein [Methanogenium organophilum]|uniref:Uncharacterized protein n=1 Tax=Methanogenium organophilum TaxID=2199 RepID=A0A9X9S4Y8_METOG|nr:hypothetical protein [Methanogenium organophilum]WAI01582.1 hypothetical protein OU421_01540 [Methanogenium organophilum]
MVNKRIERYYKVALAVIFLLAIAGIVGYIFALDLRTPLFGSVYIILQFAILSLIIYIIIKAKEWIEKYLEAVTEKPNEISELRETITQLRISTDAIGKKIDNIEKILENVPE